MRDKRATFSPDHLPESPLSLNAFACSVLAIGMLTFGYGFIPWQRDRREQRETPLHVLAKAGFGVAFLGMIGLFVANFM